MQGLIHHHHNKLKSSESANSSSFVRIIYRVTIVAGIISPLMITPQIIKIYAEQNASGVSALSWFSFAVFNVPFIIYGLIHKEIPIVITYTLFFIGNLVVAIGALIYI